MTKTRESSLYEVKGKTKWRGERYKETKCAICGSPLSVMLEYWQEYVKKDRYCSDTCEQVSIQKIADNLGCVVEYPVNLSAASSRAKDEMEVMAELDMLTAALPLVDPDADVDWGQKFEEDLGTHVILSGGEILEIGYCSPDHEGNYDSDYSSWTEDPY